MSKITMGTQTVMAVLLSPIAMVLTLTQETMHKYSII